MGVALHVSIDGTEELLTSLRAFAVRAVDEFAAALYAEAEIEMAEAKRRTPVDTGTLRNSGHVQPPVKDGNSTSVVLGFGGPAGAYALAVHEHPSEFSPPSWSGYGADDIQWSVPGTGPKFLESTLLEAAPYLGQRIATRVRLT